jgi:hypothetical protein
MSPPYTSSQFPYRVFVTSPLDLNKIMSHQRTEVPSSFKGLNPINCWEIPEIKHTQRGSATCLLHEATGLY